MLHAHSELLTERRLAMLTDCITQSCRPAGYATAFLAFFAVPLPSLCSLAFFFLPPVEAGADAPSAAGGGVVTVAVTAGAFFLVSFFSFCSNTGSRRM